MAINLSDLPPKYQQQAMEKYRKQQTRRGPMPSAADVQDPGKPMKYRNNPTERVTSSGAVIRFDSQKEARRYDHLILRQQAGEIRDLRLQADFTYKERDGRLVVEDVKSRPTRTREYLIKRKLMKDRHGIEITEV